MHCLSSSICWSLSSGCYVEFDRANKNVILVLGFEFFLVSFRLGIAQFCQILTKFVGNFQLSYVYIHANHFPFGDICYHFVEL